jgi:hypothetical protein
MSTQDYAKSRRLRETITWLNGSDVCVCGDWRSDHDEHDGHCKLCAWSGPVRCDAFKFSAIASAEERKKWEMYHARP